MNQQELIPHLFRTEYSRIVSVLARQFGFSDIETAEDIASETFLTAVQSWGLQGLPPNPVAWLYLVAKNKARNLLERQHKYKSKVAPAVARTTETVTDIDLSPSHILDSQLRMMFVLCHPLLPEVSQIALALKILGGFGLDEIAAAFLSNRETIHKRIFRAKQKIKQSGIDLDFPEDSIHNERLESVLRTLYLLFNEGYHSHVDDRNIRKDLCHEAIRLCLLLVEYPKTDRPEVNALLALMCFHASRLDARSDSEGAVIFYDDQDSRLWNEELVLKGGYFFQRAGNLLTKYHLEAAIAYWHTQRDPDTGKWAIIRDLYDRLLALEYSPMTALNRAYAFYKLQGKEAAIQEALQINLHSNPFYNAFLGELYTGLDNGRAIKYFTKALNQSRSTAAINVLAKKIKSLQNGM